MTVVDPDDLVHMVNEPESARQCGVTYCGVLFTEIQADALDTRGLWVHARTAVPTTRPVTCLRCAAATFGDFRCAKFSA